MTVPTISNLPTVPATSDPNFETEAPALFNHIKNTFVSEMNSAISFINSSTFDATVEFKNANFTAARNFLYMIDTSSAGVSVTLPLNPSTGDQLLLMDQKRSFGTNNLTIGRNGQNINGAASNVVSKSTGALIRCIFQSSYGWTVDLYEGEWESGTSAGDLVYNGGNVGIGTSSPSSPLHVVGTNSGDDLVALNLTNKDTADGTATAIRFTNSTTENFLGGEIAVERQSDDSNDLRINLKNAESTATYPRMLTIDGSTGNVGIGTSSPQRELTVGDGTTSPNILLYAATSGNSRIEFGDSGDQDAGEIQYDHSTNHMNFSTNGIADRMVLDDNGRLGIGTSAPSGKLEIAGDKDATNLIVGAPLHTVSGGGLADYSELLFDNNYTTGTSGTAYIRHYANSHQNSEGALFFGTTSSTGTTSSALVIRGDGKVGIGLGSPDANLAVCDPGTYAAGKGGQINFNGPWSGTTTTSFAYIKGYKENGTSGQNGGKIALGTRPNSGNLTERMVIDSSGNVGIGTSAPQAIFNIAMPDNTSVGTLYTSKRSYDDSANRADLIFQYEYSSTGGVTSGSRISFAKESVADGHVGSDIRFLTRENGQTFLEKMRITGAGDVEVKTGNLVIGTAGKGIDFSATSGTGTSELLDDYEEGSWTPTIESTGTAPTVTYTVNTGSYVKIGRMVHVTMSIIVNTFSGGTGDIRIAGLPFNSIGSDSNKYSSSGAIGYASGFTTKPHVALLISTDTNKIRLYDDNNGAIAISTLGGGEVIRLTISYQTAS